MKTRPTSTEDNRRRTTVYRNRLHNQGIKRVEVRIPARDVPLLHGIAGILRTGGNEAFVLREQLQQAAGDSTQATGKDFVAFFRNSPLMGVDLDLKRDKSTSRTITFD